MRRRRVVTIALLRSAASVVLLVVVYYRAPLDAPLDAASWALFGAGLLGCAAFRIGGSAKAGRGGHGPRRRDTEAAR